jgi:PrtD family type I secretion system ABC transporter
MNKPTEIQHALRQCRGSFLAVIVFSFCVNLLALAIPLFLLHVYDNVIPSKSLDTLIMLVLIVIVALAVTNVLDALRREILARIGQWLDDRLQTAVLGASFQAALRNENAVAAQAWRDLTGIRTFLGGAAMIPLLDAPWAPIFIFSLFLVHPVVGVIGLVGAVALFGLALLNEMVTKQPLALANSAQVKSQSKLDAMLRNADIIKSMGLLDGAARLLLKDKLDTAEATAIASQRAGIIIGISKFIRGLIQVVIMAAAAWLVIQHAVSPGAIFACSILLSRALGPVESVINIWRALTTTRLAYRRLAIVLAANPAGEPAMPLPAPRGVIEVEKVTYMPPGAEAPALRQVSFQINAGEVLGVAGPSGAGKTTLARMLAGTLVPSMGHVRLDGADLEVWLRAGGAAHIGYLPQDVELFDGAIKHNISRLRDADSDQIIAAAQLVGMHDTIMRLPKGYDTEIGENGVRLSGGQRQLIGLARAIFGGPRLVVLDEPNASLDRFGEEALARVIKHLRSIGSTVVMIAHRVHVLDATDKLLLLRSGAAFAFGPSDKIIRRLQAGGGAPPPQQPYPQPNPGPQPPTPGTNLTPA